MCRRQAELAVMVMHQKLFSMKAGVEDMLLKKLKIIYRIVKCADANFYSHTSLHTVKMILKLRGVIAVMCVQSYVIIVTVRTNN